jgi:hypothetical protein
MFSKVNTFCFLTFFCLFAGWGDRTTEAAEISPKTNSLTLIAPTNADEQYFIRRALELLDLGESTNVIASAVYKAAPEKVIPKAPPMPVWRVRLENAPLRLLVEEAYKTNPFVNAIDLVFSAKTRQLLAFSTVWPENEPGEGFPSIEKYEEATQGCSYFQGIPETDSGTALLAVLSTHSAGVWNAKQVVAYYTMGTSEPMERTAHPIWVVHVMGIPPIALTFGSPAKSAEEQARRRQAEAFHTKFRYVIDAQTSKCLCGDNGF